MPRAESNGIEIEYETFGDPDDPTLLLVMGLGGQLVAWDDELCMAFVDRGMHVVRFDNRDVGLSTKIESGPEDLAGALATVLGGGQVDPAYLISDMAADAWGLLDALDIERAHICGVSMGGMIVQAMAVADPGRVLALTSIMSSTGDPDVGAPRPEVLPVLLEPAPTEREAFIEHSTEGSRAIGSPEHFEEDRVRARHARSYDRCFYPRGAGNQLLAILLSGSRSDALRRIDVPALVIHGEVDPLITPSGGERTASCLRGSELMVLEGMGHDLPSYYWPRVVESVTALTSRAV